MSQLNKLYRNFIILQEDERGYSNSNDKTLSGYSKIEARGDTCKISFYAQNLRNDDDDDYCILAICNKKDTKKIVDLGKITISDGGKAEITKEYSVDDIAGLGISYDKVSGAAIANILRKMKRRKRMKINTMKRRSVMKRNIMKIRRKKRNVMNIEMKILEVKDLL